MCDYFRLVSTRLVFYKWILVLFIFTGLVGLFLLLPLQMPVGECFLKKKIEWQGGVDSVILVVLFNAFSILSFQ